jgi:glycosyltransferase involved in cell wall biosynthesis
MAEGIRIAMIDIVMTTYGRLEFLKRTVESLIEKNKMLIYRLFIIDDCSMDGTGEYLLDLRNKGVADIYLSSRRRGITFGLDMLWNITDFYGIFFEEFPYLCYIQDDVVSKINDWLLIAIQAYEELKDIHPIGFFSGHHAIEHPIKEALKWRGNEIYLKKSNSGQNLIAEKTFWRSIGYVPRYNPDGSERGLPSDGRGSHMDIYLEGAYSGSKYHPTSSAPNSAYNQKKDVLVLPGLLEHIGQDPKVSTWKREEPSTCIRP